jgi:2-dehydropantoate 2-reductase
MACCASRITPSGKEESIMSIVIVGGGAIGLLTAGRLALAGTPPSVLLTRPNGAAALAAAPLQITRDAAVQAVPQLRVAAAPTALPEDCRRPELAILCVKGYDTPGAIETLRELEPQYVLTLQNGIGNEEALSAAFGVERVVSGAITTSVDLHSPTAITVTKEGGIGLAPVGKLDPAKFATWAAALTNAGFRVQQYADYRAMKWSKALLNMLGNATAAILGWPVDRVYADNQLIALELRCIREALAVMRAMHARPVNLPRYPAALLARGVAWAPQPILYPVLRRMVGGGRGGKDPSLLRDLRAGRTRSEGEFLYGAVAEAARRHGLPAPVNAALWRILGGIARGELEWAHYRDQPERLLAELQA